MNKNDKIMVTGSSGMAGSALVRELRRLGYERLILVDHRSENKGDRTDLMNYDEVYKKFKNTEPHYVFHLGAKVGGILANSTQGADFILENLVMQCNVMMCSHIFQVKKLIFCGSACIYPKGAENPISEKSFLTGPLEETNRPYAVAKIAGVEMCRAYRKQYGDKFIPVMPTNLYGPGDNFSLTNSHVLPGMLRKIHEAKIMKQEYVTFWGTGSPRREFLHCDDLASGLIHLMNIHLDSEPINIGTGSDIPISYLAMMIKQVVEYDGEIVWDNTKPDGVFERRLNVDKITMTGWKAKTDILEGIKGTYEWMVKNWETIRR